MSQDKSSSLRKLLFGSVAIASGIVACGVACVYHKFKQEVKEKKNDGAAGEVKEQKEKQKKKRKRRARPHDLPADNVLCATIGKSIQLLNETMQPDGEQEQQILEWVRGMRPSEHSLETRLNATQWIIQYHSAKAMQASSLGEQQYNESLQAQIPDCKRAWRLLSVDESECDAKQLTNVDLLRLDIGQRLKDKAKLIPAFDRITSKQEGRAMTEEELVVAFSVAPLLGRWRKMRELGEKLMALRGDNLESFHADSQHRDLPDYHMLFILAKNESKDFSDTCLEWSHHSVKRAKIKFREVVCSDEATRELVRKGFTSDSSSATDSSLWQTVGKGMRRPLRRQGGFAQVLSHSALGVTLVGPADGKRLHLCGYGELIMGSNTLRQTESYTLTWQKDEAGITHWIGEYALKQETPGKPQVEVIWDMIMQTVPQGAGEAA